MILEQAKILTNGDAAYAEFNNGYSHIVVDDGCWVLTNGEKWATHLFDEAMADLKILPISPIDHAPYRKHVGMLESSFLPTDSD